MKKVKTGLFLLVLLAMGGLISVAGQVDPAPQPRIVPGQAQPLPSTANEETVRAMLTALQNGVWERWRKSYDERAVIHQLDGIAPKGRDEMEQWERLAAKKIAWDYDILHMAAQGDIVAVHLKEKAVKRQGAGNPIPKILPSQWTSMVFFRFNEAGRIGEAWMDSDFHRTQHLLEPWLRQAEYFFRRKPGRPDRP